MMRVMLLLAMVVLMRQLFHMIFGLDHHSIWLGQTNSDYYIYNCRRVILYLGWIYDILMNQLLLGQLNQGYVSFTISGLD